MATIFNKIACVDCGLKVEPNDAARCQRCLTLFVKDEIMQGLQLNELPVVQCSECYRYVDAKGHWNSYEPESAYFLSYCLKKVGKLERVKLLDAKWIWTEPHSRRLKVGMTIERAVMDEKVQVQTHVVADFVLSSIKCADCVKEASEHSWGACLQVRQRVGHKRSLFRLEELLNKAGLANLVYSLDLSPRDGMDLFFRTKSQAARVQEFVSANLPTKVSTSKKVVGRDVKSNVERTEHVTMMEVAPLCKGDLVLDGGRQGTLMLVQRLGSSVRLVDPVTGEVRDKAAGKLFSKKDAPIVLLGAGPASLLSFVVLDIEVNEGGGWGRDTCGAYEGDSRKGEAVVALATVARESDFGINDNSFTVLTHLGKILRPGDTALGFDLGRTVTSSHVEQLVSPLLEAGSQDIILVRKTFPAMTTKKRKKKSRTHGGVGVGGGSATAPTMAEDKGGGSGSSGGGGRSVRRTESVTMAQEAADFDTFLQEEVDEEALLEDQEGQVHGHERRLVESQAGVDGDEDEDGNGTVGDVEGGGEAADESEEWSRDSGMPRAIAREAL